MLKSLLKYDLKWCYKLLAVFYVLAVFFSVVTRIVESFEQTLIVVIIDKICVGIVISMLVNIMINCFMRNWVRFVKNVYKDESYLTHTLPVSKNEVYLSKVLTAMITLLTSFIVIIICLAICILNDTTWITIKQLLEQSAVFFDSSVFSVVAIAVITVFFQFLFMILSGIFGIIAGHRSNNLKILWSGIIAMGLYMALSAVSVAVLYVAGLINSDIMSLFNSIQISSVAMKSAMTVGIATYAVFISLIGFAGSKLFNKGVNVD